MGASESNNASGSAVNAGSVIVRMGGQLRSV